MNGEDLYYNRVGVGVGDSSLFRQSFIIICSSMQKNDVSKWNLSAKEFEFLLPPLDPYNNPLVLPLAEFADHAIAAELLHNGQSFQVLGITNYSHWGDAGEMRSCLLQSDSARSKLLEVALKRLDRFMHVGTTDRLLESAEAAGVRPSYCLIDVI